MPDVRSGLKKNKEVCEIVHNFNEHKSKQLYTDILNKYHVYDDRQKCIYCGTDIYYDNIRLSGDYNDYPKIYSGTSYLTEKKIGGHIYNLLVCDECMLKKFPEWNTKNKSRVFNLPHQYTKYAFNIPDDILTEKKDELCIRSLDNFIKKYGEEEGNKRWNEYIEKERLTNTFEYKREKYGMTRDEFDEYNKSRSVTIENMIAKYGKDEGNIKWKEYCDKQRYSVTLEYFINMYGEVEGLKRYELFDQSRLSICPYSKESQRLFDAIIKDERFFGHDIYYATRNKEYQIKTNTGNVYYLDYYDKTLGVCVEYNGSKFHPDPLKYKSNDLFKNPFEDAPTKCSVLWKKEKLRIHELENDFGIRTIVVWDYDFANFDDYKIKILCDKIIDTSKNDVSYKLF